MIHKEYRSSLSHIKNTTIRSNGILTNISYHLWIQNQILFQMKCIIINKMYANNTAESLRSQ